MNHSMTATPQTETSPEFSESALLQSAIEFHSGKQYGVARQLYLQILEQNPGHEIAWHNLGLVEHMTGRHAQAAEYIGKAVALKPDYARAYANLAAVLRETRQLEAARETAERAIRLEPGFAPARNNLGGILEDLGETESALAAYLEACRLDSFFVEAHTSAAEILRRLGRHEEGLKLCATVSAKRPDVAEPHFTAGNILRELLRLDEAAAEFQQAISLDPNFAKAYCNFGNLLQQRNDIAGAIPVYEKALAIKPDFAEIHCNLGAAYESLRRLDDAMNSYARAVALDPSLVGVRLQLLHMRRAVCDWTDDEAEERAALAAAAESDRLVPPFGPLAMNSGHALQLDLARRWARAFHAKRSFDHRRPLPHRRQKLRIGYLSGDFFRHATAILMAGLFEHHDRARFEIIAYSHGEDDGSELRNRLFKAFDRFIDITALDDRAAAARIHADEIDILVDLKGYTQFSRGEIVAQRPAPIQVNFIGYPGTLGADFTDYVIADPITLPMDQQPYYDEKIVHLPDTYQPNDRRRPIDERTPTRAECGLPDEGFVFCSFNNSYKITPKFFDVWMRLLRAVPGSVLWLLDANVRVQTNLRKEAEARGIDGDRLIFAPRCSLGTHLARHRVGDLFLDTLPYNAHTTTSDALWAGMPVLTMQGDTFAGRVASSLLHAVGLPELVTHSLEDYEALALKLVRTPELLADLRRRLCLNRLTVPAFDTERFARHLEAAYSQMWETWAAGEAARPFAVTPIENAKSQSKAPVPQIARHVYATCPLCGSGAHKVLFSADCSKDPAYRRELAPQVQWRVCGDCDHVFADGYFVRGTFAPSAFGHDMEAGRRTVAPLVAAVARHIGARNCDAAWLDVGFGSGALLLTAAEFGFETVGLESGAAHVAALRQLGFEGHVGTIESFDAPGRFAIVSLDDQLPRLADPIAAVAAAHRLLQADGLLVLSLPNMDAMPFNLLHAQNANPYWGEIARTQMFGRERLYALLREQGFQPLEYQVSPRLRSGMDVIARRVG
jgi:protein O-GlcNAc transferase